MSNQNPENRERKWQLSVALIIAIAVLFLFVSFWGYNKIISANIGSETTVFKALGFLMVMIWACIFLCYFIWAVYFYNINYGITNKDWDRINDAREKRSKGEPYNQHELDEEPVYNPYRDETFGLPPGTVRGMIAFTLLFGALGLLIVSFGMSNELQPGNFFYDNFEFFKTAFLMMIAFYFGSRSLQFLRKDGAPKPFQLGNTRKEQATLIQKHAPVQNVEEPASAVAEEKIITVHKEGDVVEHTEGIPHIVATDPMTSKK
jgi:cation transport ATPase